MLYTLNYKLRELKLIIYIAKIILYDNSENIARILSVSVNLKIYMTKYKST